MTGNGNPPVVQAPSLSGAGWGAMSATAPAGPTPAPSGAGSLGGVVEGRPVVVLWVSRHRPLPAQLAALRERLGEVEVVQLERPLNAEEVVEVAQRVGARVIVPVLPLSFTAKLVEEAEKRGFTVLYARMAAVASTRSIEEVRRLLSEAPDRRTAVSYPDGTIHVVEFVRFERLLRVEVVTEPW